MTAVASPLNVTLIVSIGVDPGDSARAVRTAPPRRPPRFTVVLPVRDGRQYVAECVESVKRTGVYFGTDGSTVVTTPGCPVPPL